MGVQEEKDMNQVGAYSVESSRSPSESTLSEKVKEKEVDETPEASIKGDEDEDEQTKDALPEELPYHIFPSSMKMFLVVLVSAVAALSGLSTYMYFPPLDSIAQDLGVTRETVNLSVTTYIIAQGIGPSIWGPLADSQGRRVTLMLTLVIYVCANVGLALTTSGPMLLAFRAVQALGSASTIALGAGIIADISPPSQRGGYIGWFSGVRQLSLGFGPVLGGILSHSLGWRSIFWFLVIVSGLSVLLLFLILPETLRRIAGNGSTPLSSWMHRPALWSIVHPRQRNAADEEMLKEASRKELKPAEPLTIKVFLRPFTFLMEKDVFCALLFGSCVYTAWSMVVSSTTYLFQDHYGFNTLQIGLCFLANGFGCVAGSILAGKSLNFDFYREARLWQHERDVPVSAAIPRKPIPTTFPLERARLSRGAMYSIVAIWSILIFGFSLTRVDNMMGPARAHWIAPLLAQFAIGWSATSVLTSNNSLVVDIYPNDSASASALLNLSRSAMAAGGIAAVEPLLKNCGAAYTSIVLAGIVAAGLIPYAIHTIYGPRWREAREQKRAVNGTRA